ncbi:MAG: hypothetical protein WC979_06160 [Candidatus Pacearchaeota archaeon]|jgi:hypothetical protein
MTLPIYNPNITSEEALSQFDYALERLVLLPRGKRNIRDHVFDAAKDAVLSSSRFVGALEKDYSKDKVDSQIAERFLEGISRGLGIFEKMRDLYGLMEQVEEEPNELENLTRERSLVESYASLMTLRLTYVWEMANKIPKP